MKIKARPFAKYKSVILTSITLILSFLWKLVDNVSNVDFIFDKLGLREDITKFLQDKGADIAIPITGIMFVLSLLFTVEKTSQSKEKQFYETPENDLTPNKKTQEKKPPKLEEKQEIKQPKPIETKPQQMAIENKPQTENVEPPKISIPEIDRSGFQILFRQGKPFIETKDGYRNINLQIENNTGGHIHRGKVKIGQLSESKLYGHKNILLNPTIPFEQGMGGFQLSNGGKLPVGIASQSVSDPQDVRLHLFCLNPIRTVTDFWSIAFTVQ